VTFKVAVEYNIYNEQSFIKESLINVAKSIKGIDFIYILDGSWELFGGEIVSTDNTRAIVQGVAKFIKERWNVSVLFEQPVSKFRTQSEKRNHCLKRVEEIMKERDPEAKWYHFVMDGDESIQFPSGLQDIIITKPDDGVDRLWPKMGVVTAYAWRSSVPMQTTRLIPAFQGYHYHTEQRMVLHDKECKMVSDYNRRSTEHDSEHVMFLHNFFIINRWNLRDGDRGMMKICYNTATYPNKPAECAYSSYIKQITP
jgi:hypothetical protein